MAKLNFTPEELTITDKTQLGTNYAETFVFVPARPDEEELGSLFITAEVASNKSRKENAELISEMTTVVKNEYYKNTLVTPISALKFSLKRANVFLVNKKTWLAPAVSLKLRVLVSSLKENKLHLARLGEASAFILRQGDLQSITSHANFKNTANLAFENIISGELLASDHIVLATHQIHKIDENELAAKLQEKKLVDHLKKIDSGIKSLALITLYPTKNSPPQNQPAKPSLAFIGGVDQPRPTAPHPRNKFFKGAVLMTILIGTITTIAIVSLKIKNETSQNKKEAETLLQEVSDIKNKISDLMAVGNESEAGDLLNSAQEKLNRLNELNYFKTTSATLSGELDGLRRQLSHAEAINKIDKVVDLENNTNNFDPRKIVAGKNRIIIFGGNTFYKFDSNRQAGAFDSLEKESHLVSALAKPEEPNTLLLFSQDKIIEDAGNTENKTYWVRPENIPAVKDATVYNNTFYLLGEDGLIYKLPFTLSSSTDLVLGEIQTWVQSTNLKSQIYSFAVEGSIFGLTNKNTLVELVNGEIKNKKEFSETISQIFTSPTHKNIYLLNPDDGFIIALDKNLNIKKRLSHPELKGAKSFVVNSQERVIYFLKGKTVYSFEI